jgi:ribosome-binding protein aMBF1 (putative translation factor)
MGNRRFTGIPFEKDLAERLKDPEFRYHFEQRRLVHEVAIAVREMREAAGLTQAELAKKIGTTQSVIARLERGSDSRTPRWDTMHRIALALGRHVKVSFLRSKNDVPLVEVDGRVPGLLESRNAG